LVDAACLRAVILWKWYYKTDRHCKSPLYMHKQTWYLLLLWSLSPAQRLAEAHASIENPWKFLWHSCWSSWADLWSGRRAREIKFESRQARRAMYCLEDKRCCGWLRDLSIFQRDSR
jgi:hypothetical protein